MMLTAEITLEYGGGYITMTLHDKFTGEKFPWMLPMHTMEELGHTILEYVDSVRNQCGSSC
jgi:hypothetical protein